MKSGWVSRIVAALVAVSTTMLLGHVFVAL